MANEPKVSPARKAATAILLDEFGALLPLTDEHYARLDRLERIIEAAWPKEIDRSQVFRAIEKGLKRWAQHCKESGILPIETILGEDSTLQHLLTDAALEAACSQPVAPRGESYGKGWHHASIMVSESGEVHGIGGDAAPNPHGAESVYPGFQILKCKLATSQPVALGPDVDAIILRAVDKCNPHSDGERFCLYNIIEQAIKEAAPPAVSTPRCRHCGKPTLKIVWESHAVFCSTCEFAVPFGTNYAETDLATFCAYAFQPEAQPSPWVSTKERMPKPVDGVGEWFLVTNGSRCDVAKCLKGETFMGHALQFGEITHWQPLPAQPSPEGESK